MQAWRKLSPLRFRPARLFPHRRCRAPREQDLHGRCCLYKTRALHGAGSSFFQAAPASTSSHTIGTFRACRSATSPAPPHSYRYFSMWFKNLRIYRLAPSWDFIPEALEDALEKLAFRPGAASDMTALGWTQARPESGLVHALDGQYLINLRVEKKLLPTTVINQIARARAAETEEQQGYRPGRKQVKGIKEQGTAELLL